MTKAKDLLKHAGKIKDKSFYGKQITKNITFNMLPSEHQEIVGRLNRIDSMLYEIYTFLEVDKYKVKQ